MPTLTFELRLPKSITKSLILGSLLLDYEDGKSPINYLATSGAPGRQHNNFFWKKGGLGPIPPGSYYIPTLPYKLNVPGIDGNFFHIQPDPQSSLGSRAELGIHLDSNYHKSPGTAGCIGLINPDGFQGFCTRLKKLNDQGIKRINLIVRYL